MRDAGGRGKIKTNLVNFLVLFLTIFGRLAGVRAMASERRGSFKQQLAS
jgi:hypothetical protein